MPIYGVNTKHLWMLLMSYILLHISHQPISTKASYMHFLNFNCLLKPLNSIFSKVWKTHLAPFTCDPTICQQLVRAIIQLDCELIELDRTLIELDRTLIQLERTLNIRFSVKSLWIAKLTETEIFSACAYSIGPNTKWCQTKIGSVGRKTFFQFLWASRTFWSLIGAVWR